MTFAKAKQELRHAVEMLAYTPLTPADFDRVIIAADAAKLAWQALVVATPEANDAIEDAVG